MNSALKFATVAAVALAVGIGIGPLLTSGPDDASAPGSGPSPSATFKALDSKLGAGTYVATPFAGPGSSGVCDEPPQAGCAETASDDAISFTFDVPDGWSSVPPDGISSGAGTGVVFQRGGGLYDDPCASDGTPQIPVGATVDDFTNAVASHPLLDVTDPVDVELGGYSGKYLELVVPEDLSGCAQFRPWNPWYYAQTPGERWHLWVLDVGGVRVVVQGIDHADTTPVAEAELMAIVDSIRIEGAPVALTQGPLRAGTYVSSPLAPPDGASDCVGQAGCTETVTGDDIAFTLTVPDGWAGAPFDSLWLATEHDTAPAGAGLYIGRGGWLHSDPCVTDEQVAIDDAPPDVPVGPSADDFVSALVEQPLLETTDPVDTVIDGHPATYLELQLPNDLRACPSSYFPWEPGLYAQGSGEHWRLWVVDVDGARVVIQAIDHAETTPQRRDELKSMVESISIDAPMAYMEPATLPAGTYVMDPLEEPIFTPSRFTFTLPDGWASRNGIIAKDRTGPGEVAFGPWMVSNAYADPCHWQDSLLDPPVGPGVDDLVAALSAQIGRDASTPTDVTVGGYPARRIELSVPADLDVSTCDLGKYRTWLEPGELHTDDPVLDGDIPSLVAHVAGQRDVVYVADIEGSRFVLVAWHMPGSSPEDLAALDTIVDSIRIDPPITTPAEAS